MPNTVTRNRLMIDAGTRPRLPPHVRLQFEPVRQAWTLLSPEKVMWPDETSLDILRRCDGSMSVADIIEALASDYDAEPEVVRDDVLEFLQTWADRRLITA
jgi:pyrroloquinoline quinone biosynthesis protein D